MAVFETVASKPVVFENIPPEYEVITETVCTDTAEPDPERDPPFDPDFPGPWPCIRRVVIQRCDSGGHCWDEVIYLPCFAEILPADDEPVPPPP